MSDYKFFDSEKYVYLENEELSSIERDKNLEICGYVFFALVICRELKLPQNVTIMACWYIRSYFHKNMNVLQKKVGEDGLLLGCTAVYVSICVEMGLTDDENYAYLQKICKYAKLSKRKPKAQCNLEALEFESVINRKENILISCIDWHHECTRVYSYSYELASMDKTCNYKSSIFKYIKTCFITGDIIFTYTPEFIALACVTCAYRKCNTPNQVWPKLGEYVEEKWMPLIMDVVGELEKNVNEKRYDECLHAYLMWRTPSLTTS